MYEYTVGIVFLFLALGIRELQFPERLMLNWHISKALKQQGLQEESLVKEEATMFFWQNAPDSW